MRIILTNGMVAKVDRQDFLELADFNWRFFKKPSDKTGYVFRIEKGKRIWMHRQIFGRNCDHINRDGLDNRRTNLRKADATQQAYNKSMLKSKKSPGGKGVSFTRDKKGVAKYCIARITVKGKRIYLGTFDTPEKATRAYVIASKKYHGSFACE